MTNYTYGLDRLYEGNEEYLHDSYVNVVEHASETYEYTPYGELISGTIDSVNEYGYKGEVHDTESLQYLRARYYHTSLQQFISEDSYTGEDSNPLSQNRYTFVQNNPFKYSDPSGHMIVLDDGIVGTNEPPNPEPDPEPDTESTTVTSTGSGTSSSTTSTDTTTYDDIMGWVDLNAGLTVMNDFVHFYTQLDKEEKEDFTAIVNERHEEAVKKDEIIFKLIEDEMSVSDEDLLWLVSQYCNEELTNLSYESIDHIRQSAKRVAIAEKTGKYYDENGVYIHDSKSAKLYARRSLKKEIHYLNSTLYQVNKGIGVAVDRSDEVLYGITQTIGGASDFYFGIMLASSALAASPIVAIGMVLLGCYLMIDGLSNFIGGNFATVNGFLGNGKGDENNYMKEYYIQNYGELGENIYYTSQLINPVISYNKSIFNIVEPVEIPNSIDRVEDVTSAVNIGVSSGYMLK